MKRQPCVRAAARAHDHPKGSKHGAPDRLTNLLLMMAGLAKEAPFRANAHAIEAVTAAKPSAKIRVKDNWNPAAPPRRPQSW